MLGHFAPAVVRLQEVACLAGAAIVAARVPYIASENETVARECEDGLGLAVLPVGFAFSGYASGAVTARYHACRRDIGGHVGKIEVRGQYENRTPPT